MKRWSTIYFSMVQAKAAQKDEILKNALALCSDCGVVNAFLRAVT
jgi:hypothetical protein